MSKEKQIMELRGKIAQCTKCTTGSDKSMWNPIAEKDPNTPRTIGYWNDVFQNYNAKLMIVGQDWGSCEYLQKFLKYHKWELPESKEYWEKGNPTWENLMCFLHEAGFKTDDGAYRFSDIYLTNALLCLRKGKQMSGDKGLDKCWFHYCFKFLEEQIKIIKPKIIATLGQNVFQVFANEYGLGLPKSFNEAVAKPKPFNEIVIFPLYHTGSYGILNSGNKNVKEGKQRMLEDFKELRKLLYEKTD